MSRTVAAGGTWRFASMHPLLPSFWLSLLYLASHHTDAVFASHCPTVCRCSNRISMCRQANITYVPRPLDSSLLVLNLDQNWIFSIPNMSFTDTPDLEILSIRENRISYIETYAFIGLTELKELSLRNNKISSIPNELFISNRKLEKVDLSQNALYYIPHESFRNLNNIQMLNVSHNHISSAYLGNSFRYTKNLQYLDLSYNDIPRIEKENLEAMSWWDSGVSHHLNLSNCNIRYIQKDSFKPLHPVVSLSLSGNSLLPSPNLALALRDLPATSLQYLYLSNVSVTNIGNMFRDNKFSNLLHLDLSDNFLHRLTTGSLYNLENLHSLDLSGNVISTIQSFKGLASLQWLNLNHNRIAAINFTFDGLQTLRQLHLAHNHLRRLTDEPFQNLWDLELLDISHNSLVSVDINLGFEHLAYLYISHNQLEDIAFLQKFPRTREIDASFNLVNELTANVFSRNSIISHVNISHNVITRIEPATFTLAHLESLDLSHNTIEQLPHYGWQAPLKVLHLHHNNITYMAPNCFQGLHSLEALDLSNCALYGFLPDTFSDLQQLKVLNISHNHLDLFLSKPPARSLFQTLPSLQHLDVSHCGLTQFPTFLSATENSLKWLDLCYNQISQLSANTLDEFGALQSLNLAHNQFATVDSASWTKLTSLEFLDLSHNPFRCSCDLKPLCDWLSTVNSSNDLENTNRIYTQDGAYICHNSAVEKFAMAQFCSTVIGQQCNDSKQTLLWAVIAVALLLTTLVVAVLIYKYCIKDRKRNRNRGESHDLEVKKSYESEKMMLQNCKYTSDDFYKEDML